MPHGFLMAAFTITIGAVSPTARGETWLPATEARCFAGKLGPKLSVHMQIGATDVDAAQAVYADGYYVYDGKKSALEVEASIAKDGTFTLYERVPPGTMTGFWRGQFGKDGSMVGRWSAPHSEQSLSFTLKPQKSAACAQIGTVSAEGPGPLAGAKANVNSVFKIIKGKRAATKNSGSFEFSYPEFGGTSGAYQKINSLVKKSFSDGACDGPGESEAHAIPAYADEFVVSLVSEYSSACETAAHPSFGSLSYNFDVKTGAPVDFFSMLQDEKFLGSYLAAQFPARQAGGCSGMSDHPDTAAFTAKGYSFAAFIRTCKWHVTRQLRSLIGR